MPVIVPRRYGRPGRAPRAVTIAACFALAAAVSGCGGTALQSAPANSGGGGRGGRGGRGGGGVQPVVTATVSQKDVPVDIAAVGNVEAYVTISVRSQVTGQLQEAFFHEGDVVKKGDKLFAIDPRPLQSALQQAEANLVRDQALVSQAQAQLDRDTANAEYQRLTFQRLASLVERGLLSKDSGDQARAAADATGATVKADQGALESARAQLAVQQSAVDNAKVQLGYTLIRSPIDGRTGNNTLKVGNLATANSAELVTIDQLQPVYVTFSVPAAHLPAIKDHLGSRDRLTVFAAAPEAGGPSIEGALTFVDNAVDQATDTIKLKATFANRDLKLWPGQFTRVSLRLATLPSATVIPSQAVQTGQDGQFVFVVTPESTVDQRPITVAQRMGEEVVIDKGLKPGETIVTEGQLRLEQGTHVQAQTPGGDDAAGRNGAGGRGRGGRGDRGGGGGRRGRSGNGQAQ